MFVFISDGDKGRKDREERMKMVRERQEQERERYVRFSTPNYLWNGKEFFLRNRRLSQTAATYFRVLSVIFRRLLTVQKPNGHPL